MSKQRCRRAFDEALAEHNLLGSDPVVLASEELKMIGAILDNLAECAITVASRPSSFYKSDSSETFSIQSMGLMTSIQIWGGIDRGIL